MIRRIAWSVFAGVLSIPLLVEAVSSGSFPTGGGAATQPKSSGLNFTLQSPLKDFGGISGLIAKILDILVLIGTPIAAIFIMYAGFMYVTAKGDATQVKNATEALKWAVVGTAVLIGASVISGLIAGTIGQLRS